MAPDQAHPGGAGASRRGERILVVDDSAELRSFLCQDILPQFGFEALPAANGRQALRLMAEEAVDLILLDVQLPDISGLDILKEMNECQIQVPVILMTAHGSETIAVEAFRLGVQDYLVKPFDMEVAQGAIDRLLARKRLKEEKEHLQTELEEARRDLEQRLKELTVLFGVSKSVTAQLELDKVLARLVEAAVFICRAEDGMLWLVEPGTDELEIKAEKGLAQNRADLARLNLRESFVGQMLRGLRPVRMASAPGEAGIRMAAGYEVRALLSVPLLVRGKPVGVLTAANRSHGRPFTAGNEAMLQALADYAAIAIDNARVYQATDQALTQRVAELTYLYDITRTLTSTLDRAQVFDLVAARITEMFHVEAGALLLLDEETEELEFVTNWVGDPQPLQGMRLKPGQGVAGQVALTHQPAVTNDAYNDARFFKQVDQTTGFETRSILCVPLLLHDRCIGVIELLNKIDGPFTQDDLERLQNVTSSVTIALENARLFREARELYEGNSRFVATVARELCSPLTAIKGYSTMLLSGAVGELEDMQAESIAQIESSTDYLITLMEDMLDIARLQLGETPLNLQPVSLKEIVTQLSSSFEQRLREKNMRLVVKIPARLPAVYADQKRIGQVLNSLVSNAYLYTLPKGRISIEGKTEDSRWLQRNTAEWVTVSVSDTGIGIAPEDQPRVFDRFFRADHPLVRQHPGRGLSLSIARSLVKLHGGRIWVESTPGQGSTFRFTLPSAARKGS
jgi:two-component system NtrC family sensor kinase